MVTKGNNQKIFNFLLPVVAMSWGHLATFELTNELIEAGHKVRIYIPLFPTCFLIDYKPFTILFWFLYNIRRNLFYKRLYWIYSIKASLQLVPIFSDKYIDEWDYLLQITEVTNKEFLKLNKNKGKKVFLLHHYWNSKGECEMYDIVYKDQNVSFLSVSQFTKETIQERFWLKKVDVIWNWISEYMYFEEDERKKFDIIFYMSKKTPLVIDVANTVAQNHPDIRIGMIAIWQFLPYVISRLRFKINPSIEIMYKTSNETLRKLYSNSKIFCYLSDYDGWWLMPMEALHCWTPSIIVSDVWAVREYGIEEEWFIILKTNQKSEILSEINKVINIDQKSVKRDIVKKYSRKNVSNRFINSLNS